MTEAVELLSFTPGSELWQRFGVSRARATTLPAGAVILEALQRRLDVPLKVSRTGLRHGALLELVQPGTGGGLTPERPQIPKP